MAMGVSHFDENLHLVTLDVIAGVEPNAFALKKVKLLRLRIEPLAMQHIGVATIGADEFVQGNGLQCCFHHLPLLSQTFALSV